MSASLLLLTLAMAGPGPDTTLRLPRNGAVEIATHNRDIVMRIGPTDVVTVRGGTAELDGGTLTVTGDDRKSRSTGPLEVMVPAWSRVEVNSIGGNITFTGTPGQLHVSTVTGFVHVDGGTGIVELETVSGAVVVTDFRGSKLVIDATGDDVTVTNATGALEIDNVNGGVLLRGIRATSVSASSINGTVDYEGTFAPTGSYDFASQNRDVTLTLPADVNARMRISTMNGELRTQIPATTGGAPTPTPASGKAKAQDKKHKDEGDTEHMYTVVYGSGSARVNVEAFNGNIVVKKAGPK